MSDLLSFLTERDQAREERDRYRAELAEREARAKDPLLSLHPPTYGNSELNSRREDLLERARETQTVPIGLAPDMAPVTLPGGRRVEPGGEIVPERDASWATIGELVNRGVLTRIRPEVAQRRRDGLKARFVIGGSRGMVTVSRGVICPGDAVDVSDFDQGARETQVMSEPVRIGSDAEGRAVYQRQVVETRVITAADSRKAAQARFDELIAVGIIIDRQASKGAA